MGYEGVQSVNSVYISTGQWRNPKTRLERAILVWGVDPTQSAFKSPEISQNQDHLKQLYQVLFDQAGRPEYGAVADIFKKTGNFDTELNSKAVFVKGLFTDGASFAADGNVITSDSTFLQLFPERKPDRIEVGLITLKPNANPENVRMSLELHDDFLNQDINAKAIAILSTVGLADRVDYYPEKLSGGQKQRVALA